MIAAARARGICSAKLTSENIDIIASARERIAGEIDGDSMEHPNQ
jgi:hypothetical protein